MINYLRGVKKSKILAALLTIFITLFISYSMYSSEYKYTRDKSSLEMAITEFTTPFGGTVDAYVLETEEIDGVLIVSYRDKVQPNVNGVALFNKGFNQRYRIIRSRVEPSDYSSVVQIHHTKIEDTLYYVISGYNLNDEIKYYGLDYAAYLHPGSLSKDRVREVIKFEVADQPFMDVYSSEEIQKLFENSVDYTYYDVHLWETSLYNAEGQEITEEFLIGNNVTGPKGSTSKAELFVLYVLIAIVMGIGFIITRYHLT